MRDHRLEAILPGFAIEEDPQDGKLTVTHRCCGHADVYYAPAVRPDHIVRDAKDHRAGCAVANRLHAL